MTMYEGNIWEVTWRVDGITRYAYVACKTIAEASEIGHEHFGDQVVSVHLDTTRVFIKS